MGSQSTMAEARRPAIADPIKAALRAERRRQGLSQTELAVRMGLTTYTNVQQWERGTKDPSLGNLRRWAAALGFDLALVPLGQAGGGTNA